MKKLSVIYFPINQASAFVVEGLNREDVETVPLSLRKGWIFKASFHLCLKLHLYLIAGWFHFDRTTYLRLRNIKNDILMFDCHRLNEYMVIVKTAQGHKKHLFFWNPLALSSFSSATISSYLDTLKKHGVFIYTFDPEDAKFYNLKLIKNVNRDIKITSAQQTKQDFYFVGRPKNREEYIENLNTKLKAKGYKTLFIVVRSSDELISMADNLKNSSESACIVDIISDKYKQSGLTLRPFDALFLHRKLITNFNSITNYDFYHPNNIYIINDDLNGLEDFMKTPYHNINEEIIQQYEINHWVEQFMNDEG